MSTVTVITITVEDNDQADQVRDLLEEAEQEGTLDFPFGFIRKDVKS